jgi:hypothetical protein
MSAMGGAAVDSDPVDVTTSGFAARLQTEERRAALAQGLELVGYIAFGTGGSVRTIDRVSHVGVSASYGVRYSRPVVVADTQTRQDGDSQSTMLWRTPGSTSATVLVQEEFSQDFEGSRSSPEQVGLAAFDAGLLRGSRTGTAAWVSDAQLADVAQASLAVAHSSVGQAGSLLVSISSISRLQTPIRVDYAAPIKDAVVMLTGENASAKYSLRVVSRDDNGFSFVVENWTAQTSFRLSRTEVHWVAISEGSYDLEDGRRLEVGQVLANHATGGASFAKAFDAAPVVITTAQTRNDTRAVDASPSAISATGLEMRLQSGPAVATRPNETVGYFALSTGGASSTSMAANVSVLGSSMRWTPPHNLSKSVILTDTQTRATDATVVAKYAITGSAVNLHLETVFGVWPSAEQIGVVTFGTGTIKARRL